MAKDLVRTRRQVKKFIMMRTQIQAVSLKIQVCCRFTPEYKNHGFILCLHLDLSSFENVTDAQVSQHDGGSHEGRD